MCRGACLLAAAAATIALGCSCALATASGGTLRAFVLAGSPDSLADLEAHAASIGVVYPTYFYCGASGTRVVGGEGAASGGLAAGGQTSGGASAGPGGEAASINAFVAARGIPSMPRFSCQSAGAVHRILADRAVRERTLVELTSLAAVPAYAGLCLDFENDGASDRALFSSFVSELAHRVHALDKRLCVVVVGVTHENARVSTGFYDDALIGALADEVFVLAWGVHWARSAPGPIAPLPWVRRVAAYLASLPHRGRFVLGVPMYGLDWARISGAGGMYEEASAYQYTTTLELASAVGATPARDPLADEMTFSYTRAGVRHTVWYLDASGVAARLRVGRGDGLAVGVWRLGSEQQSLWSSLP